MVIIDSKQHYLKLHMEKRQYPYKFSWSLQIIDSFIWLNRRISLYINK